MKNMMINLIIDIYNSNNKKYVQSVIKSLLDVWDVCDWKFYDGRQDKVKYLIKTINDIEDDETLQYYNKYIVSKIKGRII